MKNVTRLLVILSVMFAAATASQKAFAEFYYPSYGTGFSGYGNPSYTGYNGYGGYGGYGYNGGYPTVTQTTTAFGYTVTNTHAAYPPPPSPYGYGYPPPCPYPPYPYRPMFRPCGRGMRKFFRLGLGFQ